VAAGPLPNGSSPDAGADSPTVDLGVRSSTALVPAPSRAQDGSLSALRHRRRALAELVATLTWDLGGLAYEMAARDHYRLDVLSRRAAELQRADAQLAEVQRLLASAETGIDGKCRSCGEVHSRGASYCWHCGAPLLSEARPFALDANA
jgi:hypothetical protein